VNANLPKHLNVAVGIVLDHQNKILVALRSSTQEQGELWEFPGGKVEAGESFYQALCRELKEEIGIEVERAVQLINITHNYPTYSVELDVWIVHEFKGTPHGAEGQPLQWVNLEELKQLKLPGANWEIVEALRNACLF